MKILFAIHNLGYADHIAVSYLSAIAKQLGHSTYFCTLTKEPFCSKDLLSEVVNIKPDVVAFSINILGFNEAIECNAKAKKLHKYISILGGPQATFAPETFAISGMDAYCVGEGEYAFKDFLTCIANNKSFEDIPNLITNKGANSVRPLLNLEELPAADRDLVLSNTILGTAVKKTFYTSRGCPFNCAYCCNDYYRKLYKGKGPAVRKFPVQTVINELQYVKANYKMEFVKFGDDCFTIKADNWLLEFAELYSHQIKIPFNCYLRIDTIEESLLELLKKAGCFSVHLSIDSTSSRVREDILHRQMRSSDFIDKLLLVNSYGINTWVNYMLAAPTSTIQDDLDTIEVSRLGRVTYASYSTTVPMVQTSLYNYCLEHNLIDPSTYVGDMEGCSSRSVLNCFTSKEKDIRYNIYLLGAIIAKLPTPWYKMGILLIKKIPPNKLYIKLRQLFYQYYIERYIYKIRG